jgi:hypothetical protein
MEIVQLRKDLQQLLVENPEDVFGRLKTLLPQLTPKQKDLALLEARWEDLEKRQMRGIVSKDNVELERNEIRESLLDFIGDLQPSDFEASKPAAGSSQSGWLLAAAGGLAALAL